MRSSRLLAVLLLAALAPAQRTWIVSKAGGAGVDFTDIPPAIAAAAAGDTVRVLAAPSTAAPYYGFTLDKGLAVETPNGAKIAWLGTLTSPIVVDRIPAGGVARLSGFDCAAPVSLTSCAGNVVLSGLSVGPGGAPPAPAALQIVACASVLVTDCTLTIHNEYTFTGVTPVAVDIGSSGVVFRRCAITGCSGMLHLEFFPATPGGSGLRSQVSTLVLVDTSVTGGDGADGFTANEGPCGTSGGSGIVMPNGSCVTLGKCSVAGGKAGTTLSLACAATVPGDAVNGAVRLAAETTVLGALKGGAARVRSLAWIDSPGTAALGAPVTVTLRGTPLTTMLLHVDERFGVTPLPPLETPYLGTLGAVYVAPFVIGASGASPFTFTVPYLPQCAGRTYYLHALAVEPGTNALSFTNLGDLLLR